MISICSIFFNDLNMFSSIILFVFILNVFIWLYAQIRKKIVFIWVSSMYQEQAWVRECIDKQFNIPIHECVQAEAEHLHKYTKVLYLKLQTRINKAVATIGCYWGNRRSVRSMIFIFSIRSRRGICTYKYKMRPHGSAPAPCSSNGASSSSLWGNATSCEHRGSVHGALCFVLFV